MCFKKKKKANQEPQEEKKKTTPQSESSEVKDIYHVSQNKDENSPHFKEWRVRKEGSEKTIKYFSTQKEAIDYAKNLNGGIKIHRVDGKIRKS